MNKTCMSDMYVSEGVKFFVLHEEPGAPLHLMMQVTHLRGQTRCSSFYTVMFMLTCLSVCLFTQINPLKCSSVLQCYRTETPGCSSRDSWLTLCKKLFVGELIYPWRQKSTKTDWNTLQTLLSSATPPTTPWPHDPMTSPTTRQLPALAVWDGLGGVCIF